MRGAPRYIGYDSFPDQTNTIGNIRLTAADTTTRSTFEIEDPSLGSGRVDFNAPDEGFGLEWTPKPKIQSDLSPQKGNLICGPPL